MDALEAARIAAADVDPRIAAARIGGVFEGEPGCGCIKVTFMGSPVRVSVPSFELEPVSQRVPPHVLALIVYHIAMSDGCKPTGELISFAELPDARFYVSAFQGYTGDALVRALGPLADERLEAAVGRLGGTLLAGFPSDFSWLIPALPRVPVVVSWWNADEEFPARAEMLFDTTASHHLPTDGCAILSSWLTHKLIEYAT